MTSPAPHPVRRRHWILSRPLGVVRFAGAIIPVAGDGDEHDVASLDHVAAFTGFKAIGVTFGGGHADHGFDGDVDPVDLAFFSAPGDPADHLDDCRRITGPFAMGAASTAAARANALSVRRPARCDDPTPDPITPFRVV